MTTPVCSVDATGIHVPDFATILTYLQDQYRAIYGSDVYLGNDSQDGQFLGLLSAAINDCNAMAVQVYNSFAPSTAQGTGLSSVVKVNGIRRLIPSNSTSDVRLVGQNGALILSGIVQDDAGIDWNLPSAVVIPASGEITVTAVCSLAGAVNAPPGTITTIKTPTAGWQSVTNAVAATPGLPLETDPVLRQRQALSTQMPSKTILEGIVGEVLAVPDVAALRAYENESDIADSNGIPSHTISLVINGGTDAAIAQAIFNRKTPGIGTYGTTSQSIVDQFGIPHTISFFRPTQAAIDLTINVKALRGFTTAIQTNLITNVVNWINSLGIGNSVYLARAYVPANLYGLPGSETFELLSVTMARHGGAQAAADVALAFNEVAVTDSTKIVVHVS